MQISRFRRTVALSTAITGEREYTTLRGKLCTGSESASAGLSNELALLLLLQLLISLQLPKGSRLAIELSALLDTKPNQVG